MKKKVWRWIQRNERGQSATEYMLIIAVVVLGLVAAASRFVPKFNDAVGQLGDRVSNDWLTNNPVFDKPEK